MGCLLLIWSKIFFTLLKLRFCENVTNFLQYHHLRVVLYNASQIYGGDFAKLCGLLWIFKPSNNRVKYPSPNFIKSQVILDAPWECKNWSLKDFLLEFFCGSSYSIMLWDTCKSPKTCTYLGMHYLQQHMYSKKHASFFLCKVWVKKYRTKCSTYYIQCVSYFYTPPRFFWKSG